MAGNGVVLLQVSEFSLAGVDNTNRKTIVEGQAIVAQAVGSLATVTLVAGGTGWVTGDQALIAGGTGGIVTVTASAGVVSAVSLTQAGYGYAAKTGAVTTPISPSVGAGLTITTTITAGAAPILLTSWSITSNVLTFKAVNSLTTGGGQVIQVTGYTGIYYYLNGTYTVTSATSTTIVVPKTAANSSGSQYALAVIQPNYTTGGLPISYSFIGINGTANPIGGIGPLASPDWFQAQTKSGSVLNYAITQTASPQLLRIFNGVTELTNGAAVTADTIQFRAEFNKNGF